MHLSTDCIYFPNTRHVFVYYVSCFCSEWQKEHFNASQTWTILQLSSRSIICLTPLDHAIDMCGAVRKICYILHFCISCVFLFGSWYNCCIICFISHGNIFSLRWLSPNVPYKFKDCTASESRLYKDWAIYLLIFFYFEKKWQFAANPVFSYL